MYVYVDETGNTGENLFDEAQPYFVTAALMTRTNFDVLQRSAVRRIAESVGYDQLHAGQLGIGRLNNVAPKLHAILKSCDARFYLSRVEKRYIAATKIHDTVFDSYENKGVPWHIYNLKNLRLLMLFKMAYYLLDDEVVARFWESLMSRKEDQAYSLFEGACREILQRVDNLPDARSREIARSAFSWAADNPKQITVFSKTERARYGHLPNVVAFLNLIDGIEMQSERWGKPIKTITHDRQSQFEKTLKYWHEMISNADPTPINWPGMPERKLRKAFGSKMIISSAKDSAGIQIVDVVMWLFQRLNKGDDIGDESNNLMHFVFSKGWQTDFSFKSVYKNFSDEMETIMNAPISDEKLDNAREMIQKMSEQKNLPDMHSIAASRFFGKS